MKKLNSYDRSEHFNLTGTQVESLVAIHHWCRAQGDILIAVVPTEGGERIRDFTVRLMRDRAILDVAVRVELQVSTVDSVTVIPA